MCFDGTFSISMISTILLILIWGATLFISLYLSSGV